ncbi:hypothetical protein GOV12_01250 [Candidatus Pacearchaeota archaeon]|nr:hypothetical protein [Candidatus Pacearchaeota archaeon]
MISNLETTVYLGRKRSKPIRDLYNEHDGESWFEEFKDRYRENRGVPRLFEWYNIRLNDLPQLLCSERSQTTNSYETLSKLVDSGFITPREKRFIDNSKTNFVDVNRLSQLLALLCYKEQKQILEREDDYFNAVVKSYLHNKLVPFLIKHNLEKFRKIPFAEAAEILNPSIYSMPKEIAKKTLRNSQNKLRKFISRHNQDKLEYRKNKGVILGIDLAIYSLRPQADNQCKEDDLLDLFALTDINTQRLRLFPNEDQKFSNRSYVSPFYDSVSKKARKLIKVPDQRYDHLTLTPLQVNGTTFHITLGAKMAYCYAHSLTKFDSRCLKFIAENIEDGTRKDGKITSQFLILTVRDNNRIVSAKSNIEGYTNPQDNELEPDEIERKQKIINKTHNEGKANSRGIGRAGLSEIPHDLFYKPSGTGGHLTQMQQYSGE